MHHYKSFILPALAGILFITTYYPALDLLARKWASSEDYLHGFFILPVIGYFIWQKRDKIECAEAAPIVGTFLVVLSILMYLISLQLQIPTIIFLSTATSFISILIYLAGLRILKELALPIVLLLMIIPIPDQFLSMFTASLQLWITEVSERFIRMFSIPMLREGNILHIQQKSFQVIEACSGIRSLMSMTTMSILIGYFTLNTARSVIILFLLAIPVAIAINIIRVITLVLTFYYSKIDLSIGAAHTATGVVLFIIGLMLLFAFQGILELWETKKRNSSSF